MDGPPRLKKYPFTAAADDDDDDEGDDDDDEDDDDEDDDDDDDDDDDSRPSMFSADLLVADEAPSLARSSWKSDITHDHCSPAWPQSWKVQSGESKQHNNHHMIVC